MKLYAKKEVRSEEKEVKFEEREVRYEEKKSDLRRKRSDMQEKGKICKHCALIKVRIVKSIRSGSFVLYRSNISGNFDF